MPSKVLGNFNKSICWATIPPSPRTTASLWQSLIIEETLSLMRLKGTRQETPKSVLGRSHTCGASAIFGDKALPPAVVERAVEYFLSTWILSSDKLIHKHLQVGASLKRSLEKTCRCVRGISANVFHWSQGVFANTCINVGSATKQLPTGKQLCRSSVGDEDIGACTDVCCWLWVTLNLWEQESQKAFSDLFLGLKMASSQYSANVLRQVHYLHFHEHFITLHLYN